MQDVPVMQQIEDAMTKYDFLACRLHRRDAFRKLIERNDFVPRVR
jgi:hypothetical protein